VERELARAKQDLNEARKALQTLSAQMKVEGEDVRRLEGFSFAGLFYAIMGSKDDRLAEERRELLAAQMKHDFGSRRVAALEADIAGLQERLSGMKDLEARYEALLAEKERQIRASGGETARQLAGLEEKLAAATAHKRELCEAAAAGEKAQAALKRVIDALSSAANWGTLDLLGGGMLSSAIKQSHLDEAHTAAQEAAPLLERFQRELADVRPAPELAVESDGLTTFVDIFVDGLLIDLMVQSRINTSLKSAGAISGRVDGLLVNLDRERLAAQRELESLEEEEKNLLEQADH